MTIQEGDWVNTNDRRRIESDPCGALKGRFRIDIVYHTETGTVLHLEGRPPKEFINVLHFDLVKTYDGLNAKGHIDSYGKRAELIMRLPRRDYYLKTINIDGEYHTVAVAAKRIDTDVQSLIATSPHKWAELENIGGLVYWAGKWTTPGKAGLW
jgi:hypothetical protein